MDGLIVRKFFIAIAGLLFWPVVLSAAPCPSPTISAGFGQQFSGTTIVTGFLWDSNALLLYVTNPKIQFWTYTNVGQATAQSFANTKNADQFFLQNIANSFPETLESETCVSLLNENGTTFLLSRQ